VLDVRVPDVPLSVINRPALLLDVERRSMDTNGTGTGTVGPCMSRSIRPICVIRSETHRVQVVSGRAASQWPMPRSAGRELAQVAAETPAVERGTWFDMCPGRGTKSEKGSWRHLRRPGRCFGASALFRCRVGAD
jgi:hypothetical protein